MTAVCSQHVPVPACYIQTLLMCSAYAQQHSVRVLTLHAPMFMQASCETMHYIAMQCKQQQFWAISQSFRSPRLPGHAYDLSHKTPVTPWLLHRQHVSHGSHLPCLACTSHQQTDVPLIKESGQCCVEAAGKVKKAASLQSVQSSSQGSSHLAHPPYHRTQTQREVQTQSEQTQQKGKQAQQAQNEQLVPHGQQARYGDRAQHAQQAQHSMQIAGFTASITLSAGVRQQQAGNSPPSVVGRCSATINSPEATTCLSVQTTLSPVKQTKSSARRDLQVCTQASLGSDQQGSMLTQTSKQQLPQQQQQQLPSQMLQLLPADAETCMLAPVNTQQPPATVQSQAAVLQAPVSSPSQQTGSSSVTEKPLEAAATHTPTNTADPLPVASAEQTRGPPQHTLSPSGSINSQQLSLSCAEDVTRLQQRQRPVERTASASSTQQRVLPHQREAHAVTAHSSDKPSSGQQQSAARSISTDSTYRSLAVHHKSLSSSKQQPLLCLASASSGEERQATVLPAEGMVAIGQQTVPRTVSTSSSQPVSRTVSTDSTQQRLFGQHHAVSRTASVDSTQRPVLHMEGVRLVQAPTASPGVSTSSLQEPMLDTDQVVVIRDQSQVALGGQPSYGDLSRGGLEEDNCRLRYALAAIEQQLGMIRSQQVCVIHSFIHSFTYSFHSFTHSFIHFIHSFIHPFIHSFIHSFISIVNMSLSQGLGEF